VIGVKAKEVRDLGPDEAREKLAALRKELAKQRAVIASGTRPENPGKVRSIRKDIARILTILNEKEKLKGKEVKK